jgi:adenosylhomocysteine nucleosidase
MSSDSLFDPQPADSGQPTPPKRSAAHCDVGIIFNSSLEAGCAEDRLSAEITLRGEGFVVKQGMLGGHRIAVTIVGDKKASVQLAVDAIVTGHKPRLIVAAGFASGLTEKLERCDLVVADSILGPTRELLTLDRTLDRNLLAGTPRLHTGRLLSLEQPIHRPAEKRGLGLELGALAADRYSMAIAKLCRREQIPFAAVRVIVDAVGDDLPPELERLSTRMTAAQRIGAIAGSLVRRPSSIKEMWSMYETSLEASLRLAKFLEAAVAGA